MKKIFILLSVFSSILVNAQDSTKITISPQTRDIEYIGALIFNDNAVEDLYDSLKVKFRIVTPTTNLTVVSVTAYTMDWINVYNRLTNDPVALKSLTAKRIYDLLIAVNQTYLTTKLTDMDAADQNTYIAFRVFGRSKIRRK